MPPAEPIIDFGAHLHPTDPTELRTVHDHIAADDGRPIHRSIEAVVDCYRDADVDGAVLSTPLLMGHPDVERVRRGNDALLDAVEDYEHFYALAALPTAAGGAAAAEEFERCLEAGANGGAIETRSGDVEPHHREMRPVLEVADRTGAPLLVHPTLYDSLGPDVFSGGWKLNAVFGRQTALAASVCKVIQSGTVERYPDLTLVYHHNGGNVASTMGRLHVELEAGRYPGMEDAMSFDAFRDVLEDRIYVDSAGYYGYHSPLQTTLEEFPDTHLLFGTDFPFETRRPETFRKIVEAIGDIASRRSAARILGGNALDLLYGV